MQTYESLDRPGGFSNSKLLAPLRLKDFRLLWTGMTVSLLGDGIFHSTDCHAVSGTGHVARGKRSLLSQPRIQPALGDGADLQ